MPLLEVEYNRTDKALLLVVAGRLDAAAVDEFNLVLEKLFQQGEKNLVLDFSRLKYISSAGLSSVLKAAKKANAGGGYFALCSLGGTVREVFEITGFAKVLRIFDSPEAALADA